VKWLCDVFDDEVTHIAGKGGSRAKALNLIEGKSMRVKNEKVNF